MELIFVWIDSSDPWRAWPEAERGVRVRNKTAQLCSEDGIGWWHDRFMVREILSFKCRAVNAGRYSIDVLPSWEFISFLKTRANLMDWPNYTEAILALPSSLLSSALYSLLSLLFSVISWLVSDSSCPWVCWVPVGAPVGYGVLWGPSGTAGLWVVWLSSRRHLAAWAPTGWRHEVSADRGSGLCRSSPSGAAWLPTPTCSPARIPRLVSVAKRTRNYCLRC